MFILHSLSPFNSLSAMFFHLDVLPLSLQLVQVLIFSFEIIWSLWSSIEKLFKNQKNTAKLLIAIRSNYAYLHVHHKTTNKKRCVNGNHKWPKS